MIVIYCSTYGLRIFSEVSALLCNGSHCYSSNPIFHPEFKRQVSDFRHLFFCALHLTVAAYKKRVYNTRCTPSHLFKATLSDAVERAHKNLVLEDCTAGKSCEHDSDQRHRSAPAELTVLNLEAVKEA